jgi:hypothetical protein
MGESDDTERISVGELARDKEGDEYSRVVVIGQEEKQADEYVIGGIDQTVSEYNPDYPASASVVTVVFENDLREHIDGWEFTEINELWSEIKRHSLLTHSALHAEVGG